MQLSSTQLTGLLGAIVLSSGIASSMTFGAEDTRTGEASTPIVEVQEPREEQQDSKAQRNGDRVVEVRISLPDGRTIIRYEPVRKTSARRSFPRLAARSHRLPDGSRISTGYGGGLASAGRTQSSGGVHSGGHSVSGGGGGSSSGSSSSGSGSSGSSSGSSGASGATSFGVSASKSASGGSSGSSSDRSLGTGGSRNIAHRPIHTVGGARHTQGAAVGGQRVEFHDAGMGAAVIGNTIYFTGVQLVQANQSFDMVTGTRLGAGTAIMESGKLASTGSGSVNSFNTGASAIKLDFESGTIVELVMFTEPENLIAPERIQRTWTVRIR